MALQPEKREILFVKARPSQEELNARFFKRVTYKPLRAVEQEAVAFNKNNEVLDFLRGSKSLDKSLLQDIERRLRRALLDKEIAMDKLAEARYQNDSENEEFYIKNIKVLDDLINNLRRDYDRANLSKKYLEDLKPIEYESITGGKEKTPSIKSEEVQEELFTEGDKVFTRDELANMSMKELKKTLNDVKNTLKGKPNMSPIIKGINTMEKKKETRREMMEIILNYQ